MYAAKRPNGAAGHRTCLTCRMAMFIMALRVVGVMSLFPIGLESTRIAALRAQSA